MSSKRKQKLLEVIFRFPQSEEPWRTHKINVITLRENASSVKSKFRIKGPIDEHNTPHRLGRLAEEMKNHSEFELFVFEKEYSVKFKSMELMWRSGRRQFIIKLEEI